MDIFDEELINFWKHLNQCHVSYIMVGGVATNLNGYQRTTDDIDIGLMTLKRTGKISEQLFVNQVWVITIC
jgi:hypothetical protein